jgi:hypothetical protein
MVVTPRSGSRAGTRPPEPKRLEVATPVERINFEGPERVRQVQ